MIAFRLPSELNLIVTLPCECSCRTNMGCWSLCPSEIHSFLHYQRLWENLVLTYCPFEETSPLNYLGNFSNRYTVFYYLLSLSNIFLWRWLIFFILLRLLIILSNGLFYLMHVFNIVDHLQLPIIIFHFPLLFFLPLSLLFIYHLYCFSFSLNTYTQKHTHNLLTPFCVVHIYEFFVLMPWYRISD